MTLNYTGIFPILETDDLKHAELTTLNHVYISFKEYREDRILTT